MSVELASTEAGVPPAADARARRLVQGFAWAALAIAIFSGWFVVTRLGVTGDLGVLDVVALRFGVGTLCLLPFLLRRGHRLPPGSWKEGLIFASLWGVPFVLLVAVGLRETSAAQASSTTPTLMPVWAGLIAWLVMGEVPARLRLAGYVAIIAGVVALTLNGAHTSRPPSVLGLACLIVAAASWAIYTLRFRRSGLNAVQSAALICGWSAAAFLPVYLIFGLSRLGQATMAEIAVQAIYQGVLMSGVAIVTFNRAVALLGSGAATAVFAFLPVITTAMAVPLLGETPTPVGAAAVLAIAGGVVLAAWPAPSRPTPVSSRGGNKPATHRSRES